MIFNYQLTLYVFFIFLLSPGGSGYGGELLT